MFHPVSLSLQISLADLPGPCLGLYHAGTPHPNDRGGFTQWFGSCSLMSTLYVWFPASWAPMVAERLFSWSPPSRGSAYPQHGRPASGPPQT